jgi:signal transduction histidine kinase
MILTITDNGKGFASGNSNGFGLLGMKERVNLLKGEMSVHSENGTHIKISLPC